MTLADRMNVLECAATAVRATRLRCGRFRRAMAGGLTRRRLYTRQAYVDRAAWHAAPLSWVHARCRRRDGVPAHALACELVGQQPSAPTMMFVQGS